MSRTNHNSKGAGYEYWSGRLPKPYSPSPGRITKNWTHRFERRMACDDINERLYEPDVFPPDWSNWDKRGDW